MNKYVIERSAHSVIAHVHRSDCPDDWSPLEDQNDLGFEMGYSGTGPKNLASSLIADAVTGFLANEFSEEFISKWPNAYKDCGKPQVVVMDQETILAWVADKIKQKGLGK